MDSDRVLLIVVIIAFLLKTAKDYIIFLLTCIKDGWRARVRRKESAFQLAWRCDYNLDEFLPQCIRVALDDGKEDSNGCLYEEIPTPDNFFLPEVVDWQSIDSSIMKQIWELPCKVKEMNAAISKFIMADMQDYFLERQKRYAELGLEICELRQTLRRTYNLPIPEKKFGGKDPKKLLIVQLEKVKDIEWRLASLRSKLIL